MLLCDYEIHDLAIQGMITPYQETQIKQDVISYGQSSFGYDIRLGTQFKFPYTYEILNPKYPNDKQWNTVDIKGPFVLHGHGSFLSQTLETFVIPDDIFCLVVGKSTLARSFIHILTTPLEPGWKGTITLEVCNLSSNAVWIYPEEGIGQVIFMRGNKPKESYASRNGKYQNQEGVTLGKV